MHYILCMAYRNTLTQHRISIGLSQQDVADRCLIHRNTYLDYESGERVPPLLIARRIAVVLKSTTHDLWPPFTAEESA